MKIFFPESLGQKRGCALYTGAHYTQQNMVVSAQQILAKIINMKNKLIFKSILFVSHQVPFGSQMT